jgi:sarcosine oxidase
MKRYDAIVLGLGAAGSAALYHLAKRRRDVLGIDRFSPPHANGSSHGDTRITRAAIGEGACYTPLALRSHELWRTLERETGDELFTANGGLIISSSTTAATTHVANFFANTVAAATRYGIAHELLDALAIRRRFSPFRVGDGEIGYFEPGAGFVRPERCIRAHLAVARERGAEIRCDETVAAFESNDERVVVATDRARYEARVLIVAAGSWLPTLIDPALARLFRVYRQTLAWFDVDGPIERFLPASFPIFIWELPRGRRGVYGFPAIDGPRGGVKIGVEAFDATTRADACDRAVDAAEIAAMHRECVAPYLPALSNRCVRTTTCLYTVTPDFGFVVDAHPQSDRVLIASPCSGHGFKHSPALGEALAQWAIEGEKPALLDAFAWSRPSLAVA